MALSRDGVLRLLRESEPAVTAIKAAADAAEVSMRAAYLKAHPIRGRFRTVRRLLTYKGAPTWR